jgi:hypothetical protein
LDGFRGLLTLFLALGGSVYGAYFCIWTIERMPEKYRHLLPLWKPLAIAAVLMTLMPSQKDAMFILAGTGVIEAAKTDTAQRIAGKSVDVVEKYLDELLKESKK